MPRIAILPDESGSKLHWPFQVELRLVNLNDLCR